MTRKIVPMVLVLISCSFLFPSRATACVGRILYLGIVANGEQKVMAEILSTLINESTGTSVSIVEFKTLEECREAIKKAELDLYLDYICSGLLSVLDNGNGKNQIETPDKAYSTVKHLFAKKFSLVWLKPFGYDNPSMMTQGAEALKNIPNQAACIARRDLLDRFPILPRLINKLNNKISNETLAGLQQNKDLKTSVKAFLEGGKLIRWSVPSGKV